MTTVFGQNRNQIRVMLSFCRLSIVSVVLIACLGGLTIAPVPVAGQDVSGARWLTGRKLDEFNEIAISAWWSDAELRERIMRFSVNQQLAIFLDRRVDPSMLIELSVQNVTKEQFLWTVARQSNLGICRVEDFYYLGPTETAARFPAVCQHLRQSTSRRRNKSKVDWMRKAPLKTSSVAEPKKILLQLANENQFQIQNLEAIPHDLWAGFELPITTLQIRVAILLVGFGKSFESNEDGSIIRIVDWPDIKTTEATFDSVSNPPSLARTLRPRFPELKISVRGKRLVVSGPPDQVAEAQSMVVAAQEPAGIDTTEKTYTLTTRALRGDVLATAANGANVELVFDKSNREIARTLTELVEVHAVKASLDELLRQTLAGTKLKYDLVDRELRVTER